MEGLMEWKESGGDEDTGAEEKGEDGGLLKHSNIQTSQRKEINGVWLSVTAALCAKRPLVKHTPHIWHKSRARGTDPSPSLSRLLRRQEFPLGTDLLCVDIKTWYWWRNENTLRLMISFRCVFISSSDVTVWYAVMRTAFFPLCSPDVYLSIKALSHQHIGNGVPCYTLM